MIRFRSVALLALSISAAAFGQERMRMRPGPGGPPPGGDFAFVRPEFGISGKVVKSAPYSAQVVTQFTQTLADGNRIQHSNTSSVARDSEGRTRTEQSMGSIGPLTSSTAASKAVFIHDPVGGTSYMLDPSSKTAHQRPAMQHRGEDSANQANRRQGPGGNSPQMARHGSSANVKSEDLGVQVIDGLSVQGKRITRSIPAGQFGNERAMEIVSETWYSPELQTMVMSKTTDPRSGESTFKLTNIVRSEPDHALFQVPTDYTVQQGPQGGRRSSPQMKNRTQAPQ